MKKHKVSLTALILTLTLVFSACSSSNGGDSPSGDHGAADNEGQAESKHTISVILSHAAAEYASQADPEDDPYVKRLEELTGYDLDIEFLGHADAYTQALSLRFASMDLADMIRTDSVLSTIHPGAVEEGVFLPLDDLLEEYGQNILANVPEYVWKSPRISYNGQIYGIPVMNAKRNDRILFIRKDWLDQLGMDVPETLDEFLAFAEAVKVNDMNGDGDPNNEYAFGAFSNLAWMDVLTPSFGVHPGVWNLRDGTLQPDMIQPQMKEAINFYKTLYDKGYIPRDFLTLDEQERTAMIHRGEFGAWAGAVYQYTASFAKLSQQPNAEVIMIAPPKGPEGHMGIRPMDEGIYFVWVIPAETEKPEEVIKMLNYMWSGDEEIERFFAFGIEGYNYTVENGEVKYDPAAPVNAEKNAFQMHQLSLNFKENGLSSDLVLAHLPEGEKLIEGYKISETTAIEHDGMFMPKLPTALQRPELQPGFVNGNLFTDFWSKAVVGNIDLDEGFDQFVKEWKQRGGDQLIKEANEWYQTFHNK